MIADGKAWFQAEKDGIRRRLFKYTRRAFDRIPRPDRPRILDIGCGSGVSSVELAKMADCRITCIDIDREMLDVLRKRVAEEDLEQRIEVIELSISDMAFPDESFDIILAEGSIYAMGFEKSLREWKRFLKPGGFMVLHDSRSDVKEKLAAISACGYELPDYFLLGMDIWRDEYFSPLEKLIKRAEREYAGDLEVAGLVDTARGEVEIFNQNPVNNSSVCFVVKKAG
jgi:cyclopropane fatty-acyl-phospholipid synthase-like methyltransferase